MSVPPLSLAAVRLPAFLYDAAGRIAEANDLAEALAGRQLAGRTLAAVVGLFDIRSSDGNPLLAADMPSARALEGEEAVNVPLVIRAADGRTLHVLASAAPIRNGGEVVGALSIWQDMSVRERMRAEAETSAEELQAQGEELRQQGSEAVRTASDLDRQQQLLDGILGAMPHQVALWGRDERLVWANERFAAGLGEPREALVGRTWRELWRDIPEIASIAEGALWSVAAGTPCTIEVETAGPAGPGWLGVTFLPIFGDSLLVITEDVTEQKRAEEALRETRDYLDNLIDHANAPIIVWDPDLRITRFNAAFEHLSGHAADEVVGRELSVLFPEESRDESLAKIERTITGQWESVEIPILRPDGGVRIALWNSANIYTTDGTTLFATIAQGQDITERKRAEDALRRSEEHLKLAQETAHVGTTVWDQRTGTLWWSEEQRRIFGIDTESEITFEQYLSLVHPEDRSYVVDAIDEGLSTKKTEGMNYRIIRPDGKIRFIHGEGRIFYDGDTPSYVIGTVQDVTERKRAEEALRESEEKYRRVFETMSEGFIIGELIRDDDGTAVDYRFLEANPAYERLTGFSRERSLSMTIRELIPDLEAAWIEQHAWVVETGESIHWEQYNAATGGWYEIISVPAGPEQFASIFLNITDWKENDEALREYAESLRRSNEDLERFAYVSSHDLQEPLRSIVSFSQLLERRYRGQLGEDADEYIEFIVEGGTRMQQLIQDLLAYSRVNTTRQQIARTDAEDVLAEAVRTLDLSLREADATLTHDPMPVVTADPTQLAQVFANLVSNAIKFRKPEEPLRIHVGACRMNGFWEFSVSDNGIGIEAEYFEKIFVIFQRLHTKDAYPGTGIGLAIVKRIIDRHGGTIRVESVPGEGSTFFFTLPAA